MGLSGFLGAHVQKTAKLHCKELCGHFHFQNLVMAWKNQESPISPTSVCLLPVAHILLGLMEGRTFPTITSAQQWNALLSKAGRLQPCPWRLNLGTHLYPPVVPSSGMQQSRWPLLNLENWGNFRPVAGETLHTQPPATSLHHLQSHQGESRAMATPACTQKCSPSALNHRGQDAFFCLGCPSCTFL